MAVLAGKLFFSGEMALGVKLGYWLRKAVDQGAAAAAALESARLGVVEADRWEGSDVDGRGGGRQPGGGKVRRIHTCGNDTFCYCTHHVS